jgi:hypothetical protein
MREVPDRSTIQSACALIEFDQVAIIELTQLSFIKGGNEGIEAAGIFGW